MVPAYEEKLVWEGHASMVDEVKRQLPVNTVPNAILCSVGGAGLLGGILIGCTEKSVALPTKPTRLTELIL